MLPNFTIAPKINIVNLFSNVYYFPSKFGALINVRQYICAIFGPSSPLTVQSHTVRTRGPYAIMAAFVFTFRRAVFAFGMVVAIIIIIIIIEQRTFVGRWFGLGGGQPLCHSKTGVCVCVSLSFVFINKSLLALRALWKRSHHQRHTNCAQNTSNARAPHTKRSA